MSENEAYNKSNSTIKEYVNKGFIKVDSQVKKRPLTVFFILLGLVFMLIITTNLLFKTKTEQVVDQIAVKSVETYVADKNPKISTQVQVNKEGVATIFAQSPGVVQQVFVTEGADVTKGQRIAALSSNYSGGSIPMVSKQIAQKSYELSEETYNSQKDLIEIQKQVADSTNDNSKELRAINEKSIKETKALIELNEEIIDELDVIISETDALETKLLKSQYQGSLNQLRNNLRNLEYQSKNDNPPDELASLQKQAALKQLEIQDKTLDISRQISRLQLDMANLQLSLMNPASVFNGKVEKVYVKKGDTVNAGTPIALITSKDQSISGEAAVTKEIAQNLLPQNRVTLYVGDKIQDSVVSFVASEKTLNGLYPVIIDIPLDLLPVLGDNEFLKAEFYLGREQLIVSGEVYIPLDAVFQTQSGTYVYVVKENDIAESVPVVLGQVFGNFVEVKEGLISGDEVILNRNVISGDKIERI